MTANQAAIGLQEARLLSEQRLPSANGRKRSCVKTKGSFGSSPMRYLKPSVSWRRTGRFCTPIRSRWTTQVPSLLNLYAVQNIDNTDDTED